jgi:hypothetical protein
MTSVTEPWNPAVLIVGVDASVFYLEAAPTQNRGQGILRYHQLKMMAGSRKGNAEEPLLRQKMALMPVARAS